MTTKFQDKAHGLPDISRRELLVFDFDGTIADTSSLHAEAFATTLAPYCVAVDYERIAGLSTPEAMRRLLSWNGIGFTDELVASLSTSKQEAVRRLIGSSLEPMPGADAFLRKARHRFPIALVTSGSKGTVSLALSALGYNGWFDPLVCSDDVARSKPDPEGYLRALDLTGVRAADALVFEDSDTGVTAARCAGIDIVDVRLTPWPLLEVLLP